MKDCLKIESVKAWEILDSRGNPTIQVEVVTEGGFCGTSMVPSGVSKGNLEAIELRDGDENRFLGNGVLMAIENINKKIAKKLEGMNVYNQIKIDETLIALDGTKNKSKLGANATLGVSIAVCKAAAESLGLSLYNYLGGVNSKMLPIPMINILNGGKYADNNIHIQEFMIVPEGAKDFRQAIRMGAEIYQALKKILKANGYITSVGDEGGFVPNLKNEDDAFKYIMEAIKIAGYESGKEVALAIDMASTEMYNESKKEGKEGYLFWKTGELKSSQEMIEYIEALTDKYPIISVEDVLAEEDWENWKILTDEIGSDIMLVGDDLFVTNRDRLIKGIKDDVANTILIKPNQIGTVTETLDCIETAKQNGYDVIISHRLGETEDTFIADLAVAVNAGYIKSGAPCRTDRVVKYNRLIGIENELKEEF